MTEFLPGAEAGASVTVNEHCSLSQKSQGLWLDINATDLLKGLRVCKPETQLGNTQHVPQNEKLGVLNSKNTSRSAPSAPGLVQHGGCLMSGGLDSGGFFLR